MPKGYRRKLTDEELRTALNEEGLQPAEIARRYGISDSAVSQRIKRLETSTVAATVAPVESQQFIEKQLGELEVLGQSLCRVRMLMDACHEWLLDANDPGKYDVGPRTQEITVTHVYEEEGGRKRKEKASLNELLVRAEKGQPFYVDRAEVKISDPRELILKTAQETRATVNAAVELVDKVISARANQAFRAALIEEVKKESVDCAARIIRRVEQSLALHNALRGLEEPSGRVGDTFGGGT